MQKKYDVVAVGELLVDLIGTGTSPGGNPLMEANPGGAPCNVLAMLTKLGHKTAFIGKVGNDAFGKMLKEKVTSIGVEGDNILFDDNTRTTLAVVYNHADGEREFAFYRNPGADVELNKNEIPVEVVENTKILHFGTLSMTHEKVREATKFAVELAKKSGAIISFDPNIRESLWDDFDKLREQMTYGIERCDYLKISDNEIEWFTGEKDLKKAAEILLSKYPIKVLTVSLGRDGSRVYYNGKMVECPTFNEIKPIEKTGAGDTFCGCMLHNILTVGIDNFDASTLEKALTFANAGASIITSRKGALTVMPSEEEIVELVSTAKG